VSGPPLRKKGYHKYLGASKSFDSLEVSQLFWFEDIFVHQMIYAIVYDFPFIAVTLSFANLVITKTNIIFDRRIVDG
jgi:hypothetical protein